MSIYVVCVQVYIGVSLLSNGVHDLRHTTWLDTPRLSAGYTRHNIHCVHVLHEVLLARVDDVAGGYCLRGNMYPG